jgi:ketosteroid isomerase-like protein
MFAQDTIARLKAAYGRWSDTKGRSGEDWVGMMADDVKLRSVADGADGMKFSAPRDGRDAARGYFTTLSDEWEMIHHTAEEFVVDREGGQVAVFGRVAFKCVRTGKVAESHIAHRWRFRDGLVVEYFEIYDTAKAFAAATPDPK